ncbi:GerAB/ArcD/ProY family transporter [Brevibacillus sp. SYSU BS000544]|uniref:GerAB/ArcD/ProY family transporter n=1 Tax=Brevibacillus sp. SYSU BS000544 TaxID=3416443 RepID=UPI003CE59725
MVRERFLISPFLVFFVIHGSELGVGILGFQRDLIKDAGYDGWISVLVAGLSIHLIIWMIYRVLVANNQDIIGIHKRYFGKMIGGVLNLFIILYFFFGAFLVLRLYIEVVQVWMFPLMSSVQISWILIPLIYYIVSGGFRLITGACFWGSVIPFFIMIPIHLGSLGYFHPNNLLPILNHSMDSILSSAKFMMFQFIGFEALLLYYPFIKTPEKSQRWAHFGNLFTTLIYVFITIFTFLFYSEGQLKHIIWPTLNMVKIVEIPLIERFEYIVVSLCLLVVIKSISLYLWAACRGVKQWLNIKMQISLCACLVYFFILLMFIEDRILMNYLSEIYSNIGFYLIYGYIPILFIMTWFRGKFVKV